MTRELAAVALSSLNRGPAHSLLRILKEENKRRYVRLIAPVGFIHDRAVEMGIEVFKIEHDQSGIAGKVLSGLNIPKYLNGMSDPAVISNSIGASLRIAIGSRLNTDIYQIVHSGYLNKNDILKYKIINSMYGKKIRYMCVSDYVRGLMYGSFSSGLQSVDLLPNIVDDSFYNDNICRSKNFNGNILYVGSHSSRKGFDILLNVVERLSKGMKINVKCAGVPLISEWTGTGSHLKRVLEISDTVQFETLGRTDRLPELMQWAGIGFFPSPTESFGMPLIESAASGLPIVCSDNPGHSSIFKDRFTCSSFRVGDCSHALEVLTRSIENYEHSLHISLQARKMSDCYSSAVICNKLDKIIDAKYAVDSIRMRWM